MNDTEGREGTFVLKNNVVSFFNQWPFLIAA
jgi:hypothetical protein